MTGTDITTIPNNLDRDALNSVIPWDELVNTATADPDLVYVGSPYTVVDKSELIDTPFYARGWTFQLDPKSERPYAVIYLSTEDGRMLIITDGGTGIMQQLVTVTTERTKNQHPTPTAGLLVANGLRSSTYDLNASGAPAKPGEKVTGEGTTYYLA